MTALGVLVVLTCLVGACAQGDPASRSSAAGTTGTSRSRTQAPERALPVAVVHIEGTARELRVEVADTEAARSRGLMGRPSIAPGTGMLLRWNDARPRRLWMRDTLIPLDVAWVRAGRIIGVAAMTPCPADERRCRSYVSPGPADAALEAPPRTFDGTEINARVVVR